MGRIPEITTSHPASGGSRLLGNECDNSAPQAFGESELCAEFVQLPWGQGIAPLGAVSTGRLGHGCTPRKPTTLQRSHKSDCNARASVASRKLSSQKWLAALEIMQSIASFLYPTLLRRLLFPTEGEWRTGLEGAQAPHPLWEAAETIQALVHSQACSWIRGAIQTLVLSRNSEPVTGHLWGKALFARLLGFLQISKPLFWVGIG